MKENREGKERGGEGERHRRAVETSRALRSSTRAIKERDRNRKEGRRETKRGEGRGKVASWPPDGGKAPCRGHFFEIEATCPCSSVSF